MTELVKLALDKVPVARAAHADIYGTVASLKREFVKGQAKIEDLADLALMLREIERYMEDTRKEVSILRSVIEKACCYKWTQESITDPTVSNTIRGEFCSATPKVRQIATLPHPKDPKFRDLMSELGIPLSVVDQDLIRLHWVGVVNHLTTLAEQGKPLPAGIDPNKTYAEYTLTVRRKKDVDL